MTSEPDNTISNYFSGDGAQKLEKALYLYREYGKELLEDAAFCARLAAAQNAAGDLDAQMMAMEMGATCSRCAATSRGGCCSAYMGNENPDVLQVLMNLLAGVEVSLVHSDGIECSFLSERGCLFIFKPIFCLNYLCGRIQTESDPEVLAALEKRTGALLGLQTSIEQLLLDFLKR